MENNLITSNVKSNLYTSNIKAHVFRLLPGMDLFDEIIKYLNDNKIEAGFVMKLFPWLDVFR